jgi:Zn-dependent M16 (insulinase) family peptidase
VEKDFYNLLSVYLDAVFCPELKYESFLQEGWRLALSGKKPEFQGVVYNEMKGAMSSIESRLWQAIAKHLTPDLPYSYNSGGSPEEIPDLDYRKLIEFHKTFYHPSRCLFFFYGNLPLEKHLKEIEKYLNQSKIPPLPPLPLQKRYSEPVFTEEEYPVAKGEEKQGQIAFAFLTAHIGEQRDILALTLVQSILTDTDASPLTHALLKSGLCTQLDSSLDVEMSEVPWTIVCKGADPKDADELQNILFETLKTVQITQEQIDAALHQLEFQRTEIGAEGIPFGLTLFMRAALIEQHGCDAENALLIHSLFQDLRNRLADPKYLPSLLRKHTIDNPHWVRVILRPSQKLEQQEKAAEEKRAQEKLQEIGKEKVKEDEKRLTKHQAEVENQSLECLPKVTLKNIPPHARDFPLIDRGHTSHYACFTNQILYVDWIFELPEIAPQDLSLLSLFAKILPELGTGGRNYAENLAYQQAHVGGFDASLALHVAHLDPDLCRPAFSLRGKALYRNAKELLNLFSDYGAKIDFNKERIQEWLLQHATVLEERLVKSAMNFAIQSSLCSLSLPSFVYNQWHGLPYYHFVLRCAKQCDEAFIDSLRRIYNQVMGLKNPHLVLTCDELEFAELEKEEFYGLHSQNKSYTAWQGRYPLPERRNRARLIAAPVAFTALGMRSVSYRDPEAPYLLIATELMDNLVLHKEIREKGGAYGGGATYTPSTGNFHFYAYRDPNLSQTIESFYRAIEAIGAGKFNDRELEEAKLGVIQTLDSPIPPGNRAMVAYSWQRAGRTLALREEFRSKILHATSQEIANSVSSCLSGQQGVIVSLLGQDIWDKEKNKLDILLDEK